MPEDTGQPEACPDCGYSTCHCPEPESEEAAPGVPRQVIVREGVIEAPEPSFGWTIHGDPATIYPDFIAAQQAMDEPRCTETAKVKTKSGYSYTFDYAPLEEILRAVKPALNQHGFGVLQPPHASSTDGWVVRCLLLHESGGYIETTASIPSKGNMQEVGSQITYLRRYMLEGLTGVSAREDDDANVAVGNKVEKENQDQEASEPTRGGGGHDTDPATDKQKSYIRQLANEAQKAGADTDDLPGLDDISKSEASDMIDELKQRKQDAQFQRASERQQREGQAKLPDDEEDEDDE